MSPTRPPSSLLNSRAVAAGHFCVDADVLCSGSVSDLSACAAHPGAAADDLELDLGNWPWKGRGQCRFDV